MSRRISAGPSWLSSSAVAYLVGSKIADRRTGVRAGLFAVTVAATVSWFTYGIVERAESRRALDSRPATDSAQERTAGSD